jgi:hypothetical protein
LNKKAVELRKKIYELFVGGFAQCKIAETLKLKDSHVFYHKKILLKEKAIKWVKDRTFGDVGAKSPKLYCRGERSHLYEDLKFVVNEVNEPLNLCRAHNWNYKTKIDKLPTKQPPWKIWKVKNTLMKQISIRFDDWESPVLVRQISDKILVIYTPKLYLDPVQLENAEDILQNRAQYVANYMQRKYGYKLGLVELMTEGEYAIALPHLNDLKGIIRHSNGDHIDRSEGIAEYETTVKERAQTALSMPQKINDLNFKLKKIEETQSDINAVLNKVADNLSLNTQSLNILISIFKTESKVKEFKSEDSVGYR